MFSKSESEHLYFKGVWLSCKLPFGCKCSHLFNCTLPITILNILAFIKRKMQCSNPEITLFRAAETLSVWKRVPAVYLLQTQDVRNRLKSVSLWTCYCWVFVQLGFFICMPLLWNSSSQIFLNDQVVCLVSPQVHSLSPPDAMRILSPKYCFSQTDKSCVNEIYTAWIICLSALSGV